ncbi:Gfo/Idh/MocA family oxidoreductase [Butyrivibrio sp. AE2032]|uniref:Gfo/Idh/MocA family oxidoreductase n=1 Tax=Butyrivibrio sp. AE2032 TaxID=1458463 RepID=UPI0005548E7C|nr:Gfo/Idh/MocA family oxidoreductase [Butyrivibrio sp. AE2032]
MRFVIIGLGSMGKRRMRILYKLDSNVSFICVDSKSDRREEIIKYTANWNVECFVKESIDSLDDKETIDAAFVCTSPLSHNLIIKSCLERGWNVFTEINLVSDGYEHNIHLAKEKGVLLYLSSTPLFRKDIGYIITTTNKAKEKLSYNYHVGQYLPDWHPWESYTDFFIGNKRTNGCREILAIELPWIIKAFGEIDSISAVSLRQTSLNIDYDDCYIVTITHKSGTKGVFVVDVVCRTPIRRLEIVGENTYITWDGTSDGLKEYDSAELKSIKLYEEVQHQEGYNQLIIEDDYESEVLDFLNCLENNKQPDYGFEQDKIVLKWVDKIEKNEN